MIKRIIERNILESIEEFPVTAIIGARQVGKTTLAKFILKKLGNSIYLDLERSSHLNMLQNDPEKYFLLNNDKLICIDEIQFMPEIFPLIRSLVDTEDYNSKFLILGSASPELLRQSSETLAGRIIYFTLSPFLYTEIKDGYSFENYLLRGGFPKSLLAKSDRLAFMWLENFIDTFLQRDLNLFGYNIPPLLLKRLWTMLAHNNGQLLNSSKLGSSMGISHTTIRKYLDILNYTFMIRFLQPYHVNIKKRLIKSPKVYLKDTGILHSLLRISSFEELYAHPIYGSSFETIVIENIIARFSDFEPFFYRNSNGNEIDLLLVKNQLKIAIEIKSSTIPKINKGFYIAIEDVGASKAFVIADVKNPYPLKNNVMVYNLNDFLNLNLK